jgi:hypothetical protein
MPTWVADGKCVRVRLIPDTMVPDSVTGVQLDAGNGAFK